MLSQDLAQNVGIPVWHCGGLFESAGTDVLNACINQGIVTQAEFEWLTVFLG